MTPRHSGHSAASTITSHTQYYRTLHTHTHWHPKHLQVIVSTSGTGGGEGGVLASSGAFSEVIRLSVSLSSSRLLSLTPECTPCFMSLWEPSTVARRTHDGLRG
ncbi:hypothetical protein E2C01_001639 [Portunus trituberculatus]|uniref:Uncharacterized protein n=1 Tax=Portunus trituberculatus TaxID=210409 RepID=A0A5B7CKX3_PORTR|nr:hypothetical protein [Portunus trituberculatus]